MHILIVNATSNDWEKIADYARTIWPATYGKILSEAQLVYMLNKFYSEQSIITQMADGHYFYFIKIDGNEVGFFSINNIAEATAKLQKLYLLPETQGKGIGKKVIERIEALAKEINCNTITLNVNRYNPARFFYEKCGFHITKEEDIPIGEGYLMNDYVLEKKL